MSERLSRSDAQAEMDIFMDFYEITPEDIVLDQGEEAVQTVYNRLVSSIQKGHLEITTDDKGIKIVQNLKHPPGDSTTIEYGIVSGKNKLAMDNKKKDYAKMLAFMGSIAGLPSETLKKLKGVDFGTMERLAQLFMVV